MIELDVPWNSLVAIRQERDIVRRCDAIVRELMEKSVEEAIKLSFSLIERKPPEHLFERWTNTIFEVARAAKRENGAAAFALIREWARSAISESDIDASTLGEALLTAGKLSQEFGEPTMATDLLNASLACLTDSFGAEHPATLMAMDQLALAALAGRDFGKARTLCENALQVRRRILGDGDLATLETMNNLALTLFHQGDIAAVQALLRQVLARYRQTSGNKRWAMLELMNKLALTHIDQRDLRAARTLLERLQAAYRQTQGDQQAEAVTGTADLTDVIGDKGSAPLKISGEPIAAIDIVKPGDLTEVIDHDLFYLAPGYQRVDKMAAQPIAVGDKRADFLAIQTCKLDGVTLIWQSGQSGRAWTNFSRGVVELSRGETLRLYLSWLGW